VALRRVDPRDLRDLQDARDLHGAAQMISK
jgi:hypothetical protein